MLLVYSKNDKTLIIETKNISYEFKELENKSGTYEISVYYIQESNVGTTSQTLKFLAKDHNRVTDFIQIVDEGIVNRIIDLRKF